MQFWINGTENSPLSKSTEGQDSVTALSLALDRGLAFGDGVFETMYVHSGNIALISFHLDRLLQGLKALSISVSRELLLADIDRALKSLNSDPASYVLKLIVNRGIADGGYSCNSEAMAHRIMLLRPLNLEPMGEEDKSSCSVMFCETRLASQPLLSGIKHCNRLEQVLARREVDLAGSDEGLMMDAQGNVIEATAANVYILEGNSLVTPPIVDCGVKGVVRELLLHSLCKDLNVDIKVEEIPCSRLIDSDGVLLSNAVVGLRFVDSCSLKDREQLHWTRSACFVKLQSRVKQILQGGS